MKQLISLALIVGMAGCNSTPKAAQPKVGSDTVLVAARNTDNSVFTDSAIRTFSRALIAKDSTSTTGEWGIKASFRLWQIRGVKMNGKDTVFDRNHRVTVVGDYSEQSVDDSLTKYITVIELPFHILKPTSQIILKADKITLDTTKK